MKETGVDVRYYSIIYEAIDDIKQMMSGLLAPEIKEQIVGIAQVREVFRSSKFGVVAGCLVTEGTVTRNNPSRVLRDNVVIFEGALESLRHFKDDVGEVRAGTECGIGVKLPGRAATRSNASRVEVTRTISSVVKTGSRSAPPAHRGRVQHARDAAAARGARPGSAASLTAVAAPNLGRCACTFCPSARRTARRRSRPGCAAQRGSCAARWGGSWACGTRRGWSSSTTPSSCALRSSPA
jgi:hypothetical protein